MHRVRNFLFDVCFALVAFTMVAGPIGLVVFLFWSGSNKPITSCGAAVRACVESRGDKCEFVDQLCEGKR